MFIVTLSTATKQYVTGYIVGSIVEFNKSYVGLPNVLFVSRTDLQGNALTRFIQNYYKYFLSNGKLTLDTTM